MQAQYIVNVLLKFFPVLLFFTSGFSHVIGEADSVYIFELLGVEPFGRYLIGTLELIAGSLMIMPGRSLEAGILGSIIASGILILHGTVLGVNLDGDEGYRFVLGLILLFASLGLVFIHRSELNGLPQKLRKIRWQDIKMP